MRETVTIWHWNDALETWKKTSTKTQPYINLSGPQEILQE